MRFNAFAPPFPSSACSRSLTYSTANSAGFLEGPFSFTSAKEKSGFGVGGLFLTLLRGSGIPCFIANKLFPDDILRLAATVFCTAWRKATKVITRGQWPYNTCVDKGYEK